MNWQRSERSPALVVHPPAASLDEAHAAIELWEYYSGKRLDSEQRLAVELMLAEGEDGLWAARTTGRAGSRQNGKGDEIEVVEVWGLLQRGEWILHTAHEIPTAKSAHRRLVAFLEGHRDLSRKVAKVRYANGDQAIELTNDSIIVYRTRTAGGGRGLDDISRIVVDEAQHAQPEQLASAMPTLAVNPNPQVNLTGSAGIEGKSEWWWSMRLRALRAMGGEDPGEFSYLEHSAEIVSLSRDGHVLSESPDPEDREAWKRANPAHPSRISEEYLEEELRTLGPELFAREHLCVWDPYPAEGGGFLPHDKWDDLVIEPPKKLTSVRYGFEVSPDGNRAVIASAARLPSGDLYVDTVEEAEGTDWVVGKALDLKRRKRATFRLNPAGPAGAFIRPLEEAGVKVVQVTSRQYQQACAEVLDTIKNGTIRHLGQSSLDRAVRAAQRRDEGKHGAWVWADPTSGVDVSTLKAATLALAGVTARKAPRIHILEEV